MTSQRNITEKARDSVEKAAYAAVGAPTAALKALGARVSDMREAVRSSRRELSEDLAREIDEWIAEGEEVLERAMSRLRSSEVVGDLKSSVRSTKEAMQVGADKAAGGVKTGLDLFDPDEELTTINGIGPSYASQMGEAGVAGISAFLQRTGSSEDRVELSGRSGISADAIETWRRQVDLTRVEGIGDSYQLLLHRIGIWTMDQLSSSSTPDMIEKMKSVELPDAPGQLPSETLVDQWRADAGHLSGTG